MNLRPLNRADVHAALGVWNRAARLDPISRPLLEEKIWEDTDYDGDLCVGMEVRGQLVAFAIGVFRAAKEPGMGYVKLIAVDPRYHGRGMGTQLLEHIESKLEEASPHEIRIAESAPNYLTPGVDPRYAAARSFFVHHGYEMFATSVNLRVDLEATEFETQRAAQNLASQGIVIRRATSADWPAMATFLEAHWPTWKAESALALANTPVSLHLAIEGGLVIGFAAYHGNNLGTGWFGPMGTAPERRRSGIGAVLLRRCLADLKSQGFSSSIIAWAAHLDFYKHHAGATIDREFCRYRKQGSRPIDR